MTQSKSKRWIAIGLQKGKFQTSSNIQSPSKKKEFTNKVEERSNYKQDFFQQQYSPKLKLQSFYIDDDLIDSPQLNLSSKRQNKNLIKISHISQKSQFFTSLKYKPNDSFNIKNQIQKDKQFQKQQEEQNNLSKSIVLESIDICKQNPNNNDNDNPDYQYNEQTSQVLQSVSFSPQIQNQQIRHKSKTQFQNQNQVYSYDKQCPSIKISRPNNKIQQSNLKLIMELTQKLKKQNNQLKQSIKIMKITQCDILNILQSQIFQYIQNQKQKIRSNFMLQKSQYELKQAKHIELMIKKLESSQSKIDILQKTLQKKQNQITVKQNILLGKLQLINQLEQELTQLKQANLSKKKQTQMQIQMEKQKQKPKQKQALSKQKQLQSILREKQIRYLQLNRKFDILKQTNNMLELQKQNLQEKMFDLQQKVVGVQMEIEEKVKMQTHLIIQKLQQKVRRQANLGNQQRFQIKQINQQIEQNNQSQNKDKKHYQQAIQTLNRQIQKLSQKCKQYEEQLKKNNKNEKQNKNMKQQKEKFSKQVQNLKNKEIQLKKMQNDLNNQQKRLCELEQKLNSDLIKVQKEKLSIQKKQMDLTKIQNGLSRKAIEIKAKQQQLIQMQSILQDQINKNQIKSRQLQQQQYELSIKMQQTQSFNNVRQTPRTNHYTQSNALHIPTVHQQFPLNYNNPYAIQSSSPYVIPSSPYVQGYSHPNYRKQGHHQVDFYTQNRPIFKNRPSKSYYQDTSKLQNRGQKKSIYRNQDEQYEPTYESQITHGYKLHYQRNYDNQPIYRPNYSSNQFHGTNYSFYNSNKPKTSSMKIKPQQTITPFQQTSSGIKLYQSSTNQSQAYQDYLQKKNIINNYISTKTKSPLKKLYQQSKINKSKIEDNKKPFIKQTKKFQSTRLYQKPSKDLTNTLYSSINGQSSKIKSIKEGTEKGDQKVTTAKQIRNGVIDINLKLEQLKQQIRKQVNSLQ